MEVVLSEVDPRGELKSNSGFCFPGADRARRGAGPGPARRRPGLPPARRAHAAGQRRAGIPTSVRSRRPEPYFLAKAFPDVRFLSPVLDFTDGYEASSALVEMAVRELGMPRELAEQAWAAAVRAQTEAERALGELGQQALERGGGGGQTGDPAGGPQLQRLHAGGLAIGGQEARQHGRDRHPGRLPRAGRRGADRVALRQPDPECRRPGQAASEPVPAVREQLQLHHRRLHPRHARLRAGRQTLPDPGDRRPHRRRRRPNPAGGVSRHRPQLPGRRNRPAASRSPRAGSLRAAGSSARTASRCRSPTRG